jgi:uncharacterized protein (TIRG00374 family)
MEYFRPQERVVSKLKYILSLGIAVVLLWFTLRRTDLTMLWHSMVTAEPIWMLVAFVIINAGHLLRAHRWRYLLGTRHYSIPVGTLWSAVMIGYGVNVVLPRVGEISRPLYLARTTPVSVAEGLASVLVERFLDLLMLPILLGVALLGIGGVLFDTFSGPAFRRQVFGLTLDVQGIVILILILCAGMGVLIALTLRYHTSRSAYWVRQHLPSVATFLDNTIHGLTALRQTRALLITAVDTFFIWTCYAVAMYVLTLCMDLGGVPANVIMQAVVLVLASAIGLMFPAPGGLGSYAFAVSLALQTIYNVPELQANTYALLGNIVLVVLPGGIAAAGVLLVNGWRGRASVPLQPE